MELTDEQKQTELDAKKKQAELDAKIKLESEKTFDANYVHELREENKSWRLKFKDLETQISTRDTEEKAKRGEFENLYNEKLAKVSELERFKTEAEEKLTVFEKKNKVIKKSLIDELPEDYKKFAEKFEIDELQDYVKLHKTTKLSTDGGRPAQMTEVVIGNRSKYDEFTVKELEIIHKDNRTFYDKLYEEKIKPKIMR